VGLFDTIAAWDHAEGKAWVIGPPTEAEALRKQLQVVVTLPPIDWSPTAQFFTDQSPEAYQAAIRRAVDYIHAGDIFQANLSQRWRATMPQGLSPFMLYRRLRDLSPAPFAAYLGLGGDAVLSSSPERFLALGRDGSVEARPIKGTRPRGATPAEDEALAAALLVSDKDRAENLMIVDLMRNDLSRVCALGSVHVPELFTLEHFAQVHHLVSAVQGRLRPGLGPCQLLEATFPPGSITGAPKVRAMEIIAELEPQRRGPVFGAIGWIGWDGAMDMNVAIRTMTVSKGRVAVRAGGGIVAESDALAEYDETLLKAGAMLTSLEGKS
jgi:para-aminobenzoate synthetase component 1